MFRKRRPPFRRPDRRPGPPRRGPMARLAHRPPLPPRIRRQLNRAHRSLAEDRFEEAARLFDDLAQRAQNNGMPIRAADLTLQAARALLGADLADRAVERTLAALRLLVAGGRADRVPRVLSRSTAALRDKGYDAQADQLEQEAQQIVAGAGRSMAELETEAAQQAGPQPQQRGSLPATCTGCGAQLVPDEVEWHDANTAECLYCGTVIKAT